MKIATSLILSLLGIIALPFELVVYLAFFLVINQEWVTYLFAFLMFLTVMLIIFTPLTAVCLWCIQKLKKTN